MTKEIIAILVSVCTTIIFFPYILKLSCWLGEVFCDYAKLAIEVYKTEWKNCVKAIKRLLGIRSDKQ